MLELYPAELSWMPSPLSTEATTTVLAMLTIGLSIWAFRHYLAQQTASIRSRLRREQVFSELGRGLGAASARDEIGRVVTSSARELVGWDCCYLDLFDETDGTLESAIAFDTIDGQVVELDRDEVDHLLSNAEQKAIDKSPRLILRDRDLQPTHGLRPFGDKSRLSASLIFVPCRIQNRTVGVLSIQSYTHDAYSEADLRIAQALADHCAGALQRIQAEEKLQASNLRFRNVTEGLGEGIMITDLDDRVIYVNNRMAQMTGYATDEMIGRREYELIQEESDWENARRRIKDRESGRSERYELLMKRKDGSRFWADVCATPYRHASGTVIGTLGCASDIDSRKRAEEMLRESEARLRQSQKMEAVGQLAAGIAHDFNNVMTIVKVHAELLKEDALIPDGAEESIDAIADAATRATSLTKQLLAFSRKQAMSLSVIDLNEELTQLSKVLRSLLSERIELRCELTAKQAIVNVDVGMIGQILTNLVVNARDAMPDGGILTISTSRVAADGSSSDSPEACVRLSIADDGIGIPEDALPHVFEPFFSTKDVGKGTGLGLFTVYGLVEQQGGRIAIDSRVGEGTTFTIDFPVSGEDVIPPASGANTDSEQIEGPETVLVVEDEPPLRQVIQTVLQSKGFEPLLAINGPDALEKWRSNGKRIRALLTDVVMPGGMTGFELAEAIREEAPDLPVIYMSGYNVKVNEEGAELKEGFDYLPKPFDSQSLATIVKLRIEKAASPSPR